MLYSLTRNKEEKGLVSNNALYKPLNRKPNIFLFFVNKKGDVLF